jgi:hypothetical protein
MKKVYGCWLKYYNYQKDKITWNLIKFLKNKSDAIKWLNAVTSPFYVWHNEGARIEVYAKVGEIKPKKGKP